MNSLKMENQEKCHAELGSASTEVKNLRACYIVESSLANKKRLYSFLIWTNQQVG
jgi:hypothetical protein